MIFYESDLPRAGDGLYYDRHRTDLSCGLHLHNSFELVYVSEGEIEVTVGERVFTAQKGQGVLLFPNQIHGYKSPKHSKSHVLIFPCELVGEFYRKTVKSHPISPLFALHDDTLPAAISAAREQRYLLKSALYATLHRFEQDAVYMPRTTHGTGLLGSILSFISEHYKEPITMCHIARELGYDHRYLTNLMQKGLHTTFRRLLNEYRISHAKYLLRSEEKTVEQIAGECGYESLCSFNRNFKAITGTTPTAFRSGKV